MSDERSRAIRGGHRGVVTKLVREAEEITNKADPLDSTQRIRLSVIKQQLDVKLNLLSDMDKEILTRCELDAIVNELEESEAVTANIISCKQKIEEKLTVVTPVTSTPVSPMLHASLPPPSSIAVAKPRLPRLQLPRFKGDVKNWPAFWDSFKSAVHENTELSKVDKFNYLNSLLEGTALKCIQGLTLTDDHYDTAIGMLRERFGDPQQIICSHMEGLIKIPNCTSDRSGALRTVYDKIMVNIRGLEALGVTSDQYGSFLIPVIMTKLPDEIRLRIAREAGRNAWKINPLLDILKQEVEAREVSEGSTISTMKNPVAQPPRREPSSTGSALIANNYGMHCVYCNGEHYSASCSTVTSVRDRKDILLKAGRCFNCLRAKHKSKECNNQRTCRHCHRRHHQSICERAPPAVNTGSGGTDLRLTDKSTVDTSIEGVTSTTNSNKASTGKGVVLLQTARAIAVGETKRVPIRILLDGGSQLSYVTKSLQERLGLKSIRREKLRVNTFGSSSFVANPCDIIKVPIQSPYSNETFNITAYTSPVICCPLPRLVDPSAFSHLAGLQLADASDSTQQIDILIGSDYYWSVVTGETIVGNHGPVAVNSRLGWLLSGPSGNSDTVNFTHCNVIVNCDDLVKVSKNDDLVNTLRSFWDTESIGVLDDSQDLADEDGFLVGLKFCHSRYEVNLPWRESGPSIPDHFDLCLGRLRHLHSRLLKSPELLERYHTIIQDQISKGIVELVPDDSRVATATSNTVHYLPHHGVIRQDKQTTKLRVVYDGSAKTRMDPLSLNDFLKTGPNMIPRLFDVLVKFRWQTIAVTADIEQAFLMVSIAPQDRDVLRFLWFTDPLDAASDIITLRFARLVFGLRPSPAILGSVISKHLDNYQSQYPQLIQSIKNSFYVDDFISGGATVEEVFNTYVVAKNVMAEGGFNLRKWASNSPELISRIINAESSSCTDATPGQSSGGDKSLQFIVGSGDPQSKLLGVGWDSCSDELHFNFLELTDQASKFPPSRRSLLKVTASIFDPLGILSPFVVKLKILFQTLCCQCTDWDQPLEGECLREWNKFLSEFRILNGARVPRCYFQKGRVLRLSELHGFSDASEHAYAAVLYLRNVYMDGTISISLVASKTRVTPVKKQSIPRLELLGALILTRLVNAVLGKLPMQLTPTYWVDSTAALFWIKNHRPWKQYVSRRVAEIRSHTSPSQWKHCPGVLNPADLPSRGLGAQKLLDSALWWGGPPYLKSSESEWPELINPQPNDHTLAELAKNPAQDTTHVLTTVACNGLLNLNNIIDCQKFSKWSVLLRVTARVLRFIETCKGTPLKALNVQYSNDSELEAAELERAETLWIRSIQGEAFENEIKYLKSNSVHGKPLYVEQFGLYLDKQILKCKGRLGNALLAATERHPILLPTKHPFVKLLVMEVHSRVKHGGVNTTLVATRERYWILKGRQLVKGIIRRCVMCKRMEGPPYGLQPSPDLPEFRVSDSPPFTHTGLDFAGPLYVRELRNSDVSSKVYICLFTCASTRAIHLELTRSLNVDTFLLAFRRFVGRRGLPATLISDNAKTFKSSSREISSICRAAEVLQYLSNQRTTWKFIVAKSPWWGGFYERMVQTVKRPLRKIVGRSNLRYDELNTILIEVESVINCRPLTFVYDDNEGVSYALTPSHLLYGRRMAVSPCAGHYEVVSTNAALTRRSRNHKHVLNQIINSWRKDYLLSLREVRTSKLSGSGSSVRVGDVVILKDEHIKRAFWKFAKVIELLKGSDGIARAALINVSTGSGPPKILKRSTRHLIPIEVACSEEIQSDVPPTVVTDGSLVNDSDKMAEGANDTEVPQQDDNSRLRRQAAIRGEQTRRTWTGH